jgi:hypothetical protein
LRSEGEKIDQMSKEHNVKRKLGKCKRAKRNVKTKDRVRSVPKAVSKVMAKVFEKAVSKVVSKDVAEAVPKVMLR